jgi:hypothetical protein
MFLSSLWGKSSRFFRPSTTREKTSYGFFRLLNKVGRVSAIRREHFERFEAARNANRLAAELDLAKANYDLLEFDKYVQTPNDAYATRLRLAILVKFMREQAKLDLPKTHDYFETEP